MASNSNFIEGDIEREAEILSYFLTSSSESDEEEMELYYMYCRQVEVPKIKNFIEDVVERFNDDEFQSNFRLSKNTADWLVYEFENSNFFPKQLKPHGGKDPISSKKHILSFLWFAGNKCSLRDVSQRFAMALSAAHNCMDRVMDFLLDMASNVIKMPVTDNEKEYLAAEFRKISGFPNILGYIDGTSISIRTPAHKIKSTYTNRHDLPSITLQGICDNKRRFMDVFVGAPGKIHDSRVLKLSDISLKLSEICGNRYHILGDNAYPIRTFLLTPYKDYGNLTDRHKLFNKKLSACRVRIENAFGILKGRFRQLQHIDMHAVSRITKFIMACCVLHNLCIDKNDFITMEPQNPEDHNDVPEVDSEIQLRKKGERKRDIIKDSLQYL